MAPRLSNGCPATNPRLVGSRGCPECSGSLRETWGCRRPGSAARSEVTSVSIGWGSFSWWRGWGGTGDWWRKGGHCGHSWHCSLKCSPWLSNRLEAGTGVLGPHEAPDGAGIVVDGSIRRCSASRSCGFLGSNWSKTGQPASASATLRWPPSIKANTSRTRVWDGPRHLGLQLQG